MVARAAMDVRELQRCPRDALAATTVDAPPTAKDFHPLGVRTF